MNTINLNTVIREAIETINFCLTTGATDDIHRAEVERNVLTSIEHRRYNNEALTTLESVYLAAAIDAHIKWTYGPHDIISNMDDIIAYFDAYCCLSLRDALERYNEVYAA